MEKDGSLLDLMLGWESPRVVFQGWEGVTQPPVAGQAQPIAIYLGFVEMAAGVTDRLTGQRYSLLYCAPWASVLVDTPIEEVREMLQQQMAAEWGNDEDA